MKPRRSAAFTLIEMLISCSLLTVLGSIIYLVASEAVFSFARNISINRSYNDARITLERVGQTIESGAYAPQLVDTNGAALAIPPGTAGGPSAGATFYRCDNNPSYKITSATTSATSTNRTMIIQVAVGQRPPIVKDLVVVPTLGYQGVVSSVAPALTAPPTAATSVTLTFVDTLAADFGATLTSAVDFTNPQQYCQIYTKAAFIVVGQQLRYYSVARSVAADTAAVFNNPANYLVLVNLVASAQTSGATVAATLQPFSVVNPPLLTVQLYAEDPEYNAGRLNSANTYTFMQSSLGSRCPAISRCPP